MLTYNGCEGARKQGYDSIQLPNSFGGYVNELIDCRGKDQPGADDVWELACPPPHVELRLGLPPSHARHAPHVSNSTVLSFESCGCCCDDSLSHLNCNRGLL